MPLWIALLRGINVSGHKPIKMELLRAAFEALGFEDVKTHLQSGNVVFRSTASRENRLAAKITGRILEDFGLAVPVLLRTPEELRAISQANPFGLPAGADDKGLYVTFLSAPAPAGAEEKLRALAAASEQIAASGREIFLHCPAGYGNSKVSNAVIEKKLGVQATTRNRRTINALAGLTQP